MSFFFSSTKIQKQKATSHASAASRDKKKAIDKRVIKACRYIEKADHTPGLQEVADHVDLSPSYLHRIFKNATGITTRAFTTMIRSKKYRHQLLNHHDQSITDTLYATGFNTSSRFYAEAQRRLGMTPGQFKKQGSNTAIFYAVSPCRLGYVLIATTQKGIAAVILGDSQAALTIELANMFKKARCQKSDAFQHWCDIVVDIIDGKSNIPADLPLDIRGTAFQQKIWQALTEIPAGTTITYGDLAIRLDMPGSTRAVARAIASNYHAVIIPCHRVIAKDGRLSGYRWGQERKRTLLAAEGITAYTR